MLLFPRSIIPQLATPMSLYLSCPPCHTCHCVASSCSDSLSTQYCTELYTYIYIKLAYCTTVCMASTVVYCMNQERSEKVMDPTDKAHTHALTHTHAHTHARTLTHTPYKHTHTHTHTHIHTRKHTQINHELSLIK